jgi:ribosome-associated protein
LEFARSLITALEEKKGEDITLIDIREVTTFAEYFIICSGTSDRMLQALADAVSQQAKQMFGLLGRIEGQSRDGWILVDFGDAIVHLFSRDRRDYYRLEELWNKGKVLVHLQ